jgi:hypothetical protein
MCKKYLPKYFTQHPRQLSETFLVSAVHKGELFGMLEVEIEVPNENDFRRQDCTPLEYFSEFLPLFVTCDVPYE